MRSRAQPSVCNQACTPTLHTIKQTATKVTTRFTSEAGTLDFLPAHVKAFLFTGYLFLQRKTSFASQWTLVWIFIFCCVCYCGRVTSVVWLTRPAMATGLARETVTGPPTGASLTWPAPVSRCTYPLDATFCKYICKQSFRHSTTSTSNLNILIFASAVSPIWSLSTQRSRNGQMGSKLVGIEKLLDFGKSAKV